MTSKLWRLIIIGICSIVFSVYATTVAANTIFSIVPVSIPTKIVKGRTAVGTYTITNNYGQRRNYLHLNNTSSITQSSDTGSGICSNPSFGLNNHGSCVLKLNLIKSQSGTIGNPNGEPIISDLQDPTLSSRPLSSDRLNVQVVDSPTGDMPTLTLNPVSELVLIPGEAVTLTITNSSATATANNVDITLPANIESEINTKTRTGCDNVAPGDTCTITLTAKSGAAIDPFPQSAIVQGANTQTANIDVDVQGEVSAAAVSFSNTGAQNLTLTNNSSSDVTVNNVVLSSGVHNVSVGSLANCQPLSASGTCTVPLTAVQNSYGSGTATITYNSSETVTPAPTITVDNTSLDIRNYMDLNSNQSGQDFTITNNGNFTWQNADFSGVSLTGVTPVYTDCTGTALTPSNSCTIIFNTSGATPGDNAVLSTTGDNISTYTSNVTILGAMVVEADTTPANKHLGYRALKVSNTSASAGKVTSVTSNVSSKIHFCSSTDPSCVYQSTCVLDQDIPAGENRLIWLKALDADQPVETDDVAVVVAGTTTANKNKHKVNDAFSHTFDVDYSKSLFADGSFTTAGGISANYIAKWNGSVWSALGSGMNASLICLAKDNSGDLFVGGGFTTAGGISANKIAKWNGSAWSALGSGMDNTVQALIFDTSGNLFAGGRFTTAGGISASKVAKWDGSDWSALGSGVGSHVFGLIFDGSGNLFVAGEFTTAGGSSANRIAKWNGSAWSALGSGLNSRARTFIYDSSEDLLVAGDFTTAGGIEANRIAKWNGSSWSAFGGTGFDSLVRGLVYDSSENLYVAGNFATAGGIEANKVAKWNGSVWSALGSGVDAYLTSIAYDNSNIYVGGNFANAGGISANKVAKWNGSVWSALGSGMNFVVNALLITPVIDSITAVPSPVSFHQASGKIKRTGVINR